MRRKRVRQMRKNKISLDFTSLLDITMIILFFFLINFKLSADETKAEAAARIGEATAAMEQLEADMRQFEEEKEEWQREAEREMSKLREADKNAAENAQALLDFQNGKILKITLDMTSRSDWKITVYSGDTAIGEILPENSGDISGEIVSILNSSGFQNEDVIIGVFMYDPTNIGSGRIPEDFIPQIKEVCGVYENFYCAEVRK